ANQHTKMRPESLPDLAENKFSAESQPERVASAAASHMLALPRLARLPVKRPNERRALRKVFFNGSAHAFKQRRHIQEIMRCSHSNFIGKLVQIGGEHKNAFA